MSIESEIFKKSYVDLAKLKQYGFTEEKGYYRYSFLLMNKSFKADIFVKNTNEVLGKIYDVETNEEYTNIRIENNIGKFVNEVKEEYKKILFDIKNKCFEDNYFINKQTNRITKYIIDKYNVNPEFLWEKSPNHGVFRNKYNNKWFGIIMTIDRSKITTDTGEIEIINVKVDENKFNNILGMKGYYKAYHMNKKNWITIILDDTIVDKDIFQLIDDSYNLIIKKENWIVPANPKYYDVIGHFKKNDTIEWKQSSTVHVGDIVFIYLGSPYSAIIYKCQAIEVNIPYRYKDANLDINYAMKLKLVKNYKEDEITFKKLNELGINSIRGPRKISEEISKLFL